MSENTQDQAPREQIIEHLSQIMSRGNAEAMVDQFAATLKAAQGGVTDAMVREVRRCVGAFAQFASKSADQCDPTSMHLVLCEAHNALEAALSAQPAERVPEGMVLVPAEASDADAFMVLYEYQQPGRTRKDAYRIAIRKLAERAAPSPARGPEIGCNCGADYTQPIITHKASCRLVTSPARGDGGERRTNYVSGSVDDAGTFHPTTHAPRP